MPELPKLCCKSSDVDPDDKAFAPEVTGDRKCTDCFFLIVFGVFWVGMLVVAIVGMQHGNPTKLFYATDYEGNVCGSTATTCNGDCSTKTDINYPRITEDLFAAAAGGIPTDPTQVKLYGVCTNGCPERNDYVCDYQGLSKIQSLFPTANLGDNLVRGPSSAARRLNSVGATVGSPEWNKLQTCQAKVDALPGSNGAVIGLAPWKLIPDNGDSCSDLLQHCWFQGQKSKAYFFRCVPQEPREVSTVEVCVRPKSLRDQPNSPGCKEKRVETVEVLLTPAQENVLAKQMNGVAMKLSRYFADLEKSKLVVLGLGAGFAMVLGFVWITLLRFFSTFMVWATVKLVLLSLLSITLMLYSQADLLDFGTAATVVDPQAGANDGNTTNTPMWASGATPENLAVYKYAAYAATAVTTVCFAMTLYLRRHINIACGIIKEASKAIHCMPMLMFFPIVTFSLVTLLSVYWLIIAAYLQSSSSISMGSMMPNVTLPAAMVAMANATLSNATTTGYSMGTVNQMDVLKYMQLYHFFGLLWTNQFIQAIGVTTIAGAVCAWYWEEDKEDMHSSPVAQALKRAVLYHLGSIAFGSFIVATIQFLRFMLAYLDKKSKGLQDANMLIKIAFKAVACLLWCFEKCVKFINKNAFILIAMMGWNFCRATKNAVVLITKNVKQIGTTNMIGTLMMYMGKVCIAFMCGIAAFGVLSIPSQKAQLESIMLPVLVTIMVAYFVATAFLEVYDMAIDSILLCFCLDRANNDGSDEKPYFMGDSLRKFISANTKKKRKNKEGVF